MIDSTMSIGPAASTVMFMITLIGAGVIYRLMRDRIIYEMVTLKKRDRGVEEDIINHLERNEYIDDDDMRNIFNNHWGKKDEANEE